MTPNTDHQGRLPGSPARRPTKRGVLLLVVLSLLTLFMLLGTTYMVVTSRARATARAFARASEASHSAQSAAGRRFVDEAFLAVARGPVQPPPTWAFPQGEDLLGDKYGYASTSTTAPVDRQMLTGTLTSGTALNPSRTLVYFPVTGPVAGAAPETLSGRVITFLLPDFTWSTRILRARGTSGGTTTALVISLAAVSGSRSVTFEEINAAIAKAPTVANSPPHCVVNSREFVGQAGTDTNEPYDGFDTANPFLAQIVETPAYSPTAPISAIGTGSCVRASYQSSGNALRVDNDGDGVLDSCWVDFGFPTVRDATGVVCKPKAAVLILDLDGRFNVNAHGSLAEVDILQLTDATKIQWPTAAPQLPSGVSAATFAALPIGSGYGPAEIRLADLLLVSSTSTAAATANQLLSSTTTLISGSQGAGKRPTVSARSPLGRYGDAGASPQPGISGVDDALSVIQDQQRARTSDGEVARGQSLCSDWRMNTTFQKWQANPDDYTSPPDLSGRMKVYADRQAPGDGVVARIRYAKPVVSGSHWWQGDTTDDPYEVRLDRRSAADATFGPDELERVLRIYDWDAAQLSSRLAALLGPDAERLRLLLTTESWDTTAIVGPARKKIEAALAATTASTWTEVFAPELIGGRRIDINRPVQSAVEKEYLCRQLYTLLWALTGSSDWKSMAQWAVNVVDFRDADSTITRFAYDKNPADGWTPGTDVVWGVERPDLLIDEALAWQSGGGGDGGVYVTLHHPWSSKAVDGNAFYPHNVDEPAWQDPGAVDPELGVPATGPGSEPLNVLNLDTRGGGDKDSPVWRLKVDSRIVRLDEPPNDQAGTGEFWSKPLSSGTNRQVPPDGTICVFGESKRPTNGTVDVDTAFPASAQLKIDMQGSSPANLTPGSAATVTIILERLADPTQKFVSGTNDYVEVDRMDGLTVVDRTPDPITKLPLEPHIKRDRKIDANVAGTFWKQDYEDQPESTPTKKVQIEKPTASPRVACMPWLNRPYISVAELALVPPWDASKLLYEYSGFKGNGMLDNLAKVLNINPSQQPEFFANLIESVAVPSRFAGIATTIDEYPAAQNPLQVPTSQADCDPGLDKLPINQLTGYREPGRVNLNTVSDQRIWEATVLRGPRPAGMSTVGNAALDWTSSNLGRPGSAAQPAASALQLLALKGGTSSTTVSGTVVADTADPGPDPAANPQFQYLTANRLANVATTRSHVFAVWVTIGFFDPVTDQELGTDTGDVQRHRGFFIFDRSIPVAYETGKDHNVRDAILLRRIIQ